MPIILNDIKLDFKDVLLRPKRSTLHSRSDVNIVREMTFKNSKRTYKGVPIIASNMDTVGTFEMAKAIGKHGLFTTIHKYYTIDEWKKFAEENPNLIEHVAPSSGSGNEDFERLCGILKAVPSLSFICLDVANGYTQHFVEFVRKTRQTFPTHTIIGTLGSATVTENLSVTKPGQAIQALMLNSQLIPASQMVQLVLAGNVVTGEMVEELLLSGADIIKVGIGPGSVCTTRLQTGVGFPQLSAILECADAAHGLEGHIISDGGCNCPGDVAKAFGAGADFVMIGGMFAGHDESGGEVITKEDGKKYKLFYGMSSTTAMTKYSGGVAEYRSAEGKTVEVPYRGEVEKTVLSILGGIRSTCTYVGAHSIRELPKRSTFIRCTQQANTVYGS